MIVPVDFAAELAFALISVAEAEGFKERVAGMLRRRHIHDPRISSAVHPDSPWQFCVLLPWLSEFSFLTGGSAKMESIVQLVFSAFLLGCLVWVKLHDVNEVLEMLSQRSKRKYWKKAVVMIVLSLLGTAAFLDPLIPGMPTLTVRVSTACTAYDRLSDHLRVKVVPLGLGGIAGGDRISDAAFGGDGSVQIIATLAMLDTHVLLEIYDETSPAAIIKSDTIYINPFVRRQLIGKTITLCKTGDTHE